MSPLGTVTCLRFLFLVIGVLIVPCHSSVSVLNFNYFSVKLDFHRKSEMASYSDRALGSAIRNISPSVVAVSYFYGNILNLCVSC